MSEHNELIDDIADSLNESFGFDIEVEDVSTENMNKDKWIYPVNLTIRINLGEIEIIEPGSENNDSENFRGKIRFEDKYFTFDLKEEAIEYIKNKVLERKNSVKCIT